MEAHFPLPSYIRKKKFKSEADRRKTISRFYVRLAALYASEMGTLSKLAMMIGYTNKRSLPTTLLQRDQVTPAVAVAIERAVGRDIMPRELLRPDLFDLNHKKLGAASADQHGEI